MSLQTYLNEVIDLLQSLHSETLEKAVTDATNCIVHALSQNYPLLVCGNGGSASDAMHIAGELVGRFKRERRGLNVNALSTNPAIVTAWGNDYDFESIFSRQVEAYGCKGGVLLGISTSGNSTNVIAALKQARDQEMSTIGLTGNGGGAMAKFCDILINVPSHTTAHIQEGHVCLYHFLCDKIEQKITELQEVKN